MPEPDGTVTLLLTQVRDGNQEAANQLIPLIYKELRQMAGACMRGERPSHTLQATALVNEAYMRLVGGGNPVEWQNRAHFFAIAAHTMREVLMDYARRSRAANRGGGDNQRVELDEGFSVASGKLEEVIAIDDALERQAQIDPRQSRIVELRFFAGLNVEEAAEVMGVSPKTIKREWRSAKAWLHRGMDTVKAK
jgi:RNA polymerase sigma-70 factor (ECF subfamily)